MNTSQTPAPQTFPMPNEAEGARIAALDVVRGVAVLGILVANIVAFGQGMTAYAWPGGFLAPPGPFADWLWGAQLVLVDGKFRALFTLLFGAGMVLFFRRAQAKGAGHGLLARRLGWLGLFGFAHWALLWRGDILLSYAIGGLAVLAFVGWEWTRQLTLGLIGYTVGTIAVTAAAAAPMVVAALPRTAEARAGLAQAKADEIADGKVEAALSMAGDYGGMIRHTLGEHLALLPGDTLPVLFETVPSMLIGMALLGAGVFEGDLAPRRQAAWGWTLWLLGMAATVPIAAWAMARGIGYWDSFAAIFGWAMAPNLLSALGLLLLLSLWARRAGGDFARLLAATGQCAFTNYIGTSALALAVFSGLGLGLFGKLGRLELYGVMALFWLVMLAWPAWWLARFRYGPLEWLWRCLTYWRVVSPRR